MNGRKAFDDLVLASATELFCSRGVEVRPAPQESAEGSVEYAATVGFASDRLRGMVGIGMAPKTLQRLVAADEATGPTTIGEDWLAESVNQLLGRLKNKLLGYNVVLSIALPTVLRGVRLEFLSTGRTNIWTYPFECAAGPIWVWLDVRADQAFELAPSSDPALKGTPEGELLLF